MANLVTNKCKYELFTGAALMGTSADMRVLLLKSNAPDADTNFVTQIAAGEITVSGYSRQALSGETVTEDDTNDFAYLDATDPVFTALATGETIIGAVLYRFVTNDTDSPVFAYYDTTDTPTNGGNITIQFAAVGSGGALKGA